MAFLNYNLGQARFKFYAVIRLLLGTNGANVIAIYLAVPV